MTDEAREAAWNRAIDDDVIRAVRVDGMTYTRMQQSFNSGYDIGHAAGVVEGIRQAREAAGNLHIVSGQSGDDGGRFTIRISDWDDLWESLTT